MANEEKIMGLINIAGLMVATIFMQSATPRCDGDAYKAFDFWVGTWDVFSVGGPQDGGLAGTNRITKKENGCLVLEEWTGSDGSTGQSYNYYDPARDKWRQVWVSAGAVIDYEGGLDEAGTMRLEGTITYRGGKTAPFKGTWTSQKDGSVLQDFRQYSDKSEKWEPWFTGRYVRQAAPREN